MHFETKQAGEQDLDTVVQILREGRDFQRKQGFVQWNDSFPDPKEISQNILEGKIYLFLADAVPAGCFLLDEEEPVYGTLPKGSRVLHRTALGEKFQGKGLGNAFFESMITAADASFLWIDTHPDNKRMLHVLEREGFDYIQDVWYPFGKRLLFKRTRDVHNNKRTTS